MIPKKWIINWRSFAPWATESQIEQDLVLSRIIVEIFSDSYLSTSVAFRGFPSPIFDCMDKYPALLDKAL